MSATETESYIVDVERRRPWLHVATVRVVMSGAQGESAPLVSLRALTRRGARRRAGRFVALRRSLIAGTAERPGPA